MKYRCTLCGEIYDEDREGVEFSDLPDDWVCPLCRSPKSAFEPLGEDVPEPVPEEAGEFSTAQDAAPVRCSGPTDMIHAMAGTGRSVTEAMDTLLPVPGFDGILFLGGQLAHMPLDDDAEVRIRTVIGKRAEHPLVLDTPVYISHMSFGALSGSAKIALAKGASAAGTAMCSGEGGALYDEMAASDRYIFEFVPNGYSTYDETFERCAATEIKIGQGTKPGMGGHLPGSKVNGAIAVMRERPEGKDIQSPSRFPGVATPDDLRETVAMLRRRSGGKPVGIKIAAGHIEEDLEFISETGCDFITVDGRGGATASSPKFLKDASSVPTVYALSRARKYMDEQGMKQDLVITGGLRTSGDFVKALAMGADAVAVASAALMALGCRRYRVCDAGACPMGIATQDPELERRLDIVRGAERVANYLNAVSEELRTFVRVSGHGDIHELSPDDLCTVDPEIERITGIRHA